MSSVITRGSTTTDNFKRTQFQIVVEPVAKTSYDIETGCNSTTEKTNTDSHGPMRIEATNLKVRWSGSYEESVVASFSSDGYTRVEKVCIGLG